MKTKHTPGPWIWDINRPKAYDLTWLTDEKGKRILTMYGGPRSNKSEGFPLPEYRALIAAAPDLLEACELAETTVERLNRHDSANGTLSVIRAALDKAKS